MADQSITEEWRPVVGWEGLYEVSNLGNVRSVRRAKILALGGSRYKHATLCRDNACTSINVNVLVLEAFVSHRPAGMMSSHNDGDKTNNRLDNLRWDTQSGNLADRKIHGTESIGARNGKSKLRPEDIPEIRRMIADGRWSLREIGERYGTTLGAISGIKYGKTWTHV